MQIFDACFHFIFGLNTVQQDVNTLTTRAGAAQIRNHSSFVLSAPPTAQYCLTNFVLPSTTRLPAVSEVQFNLSDQTPSTISSTSRTEWICRDENRSIFGDQIPWRYKAGQFSLAHLMCWSCCTRRATLRLFCSRFFLRNGVKKRQQRVKCHNIAKIVFLIVKAPLNSRHRRVNYYWCNNNVTYLASNPWIHYLS